MRSNGAVALVPVGLGVAGAMDGCTSGSSLVGRLEARGFTAGLPRDTLYIAIPSWLPRSSPGSRFVNLHVYAQIPSVC